MLQGDRRIFPVTVYIGPAAPCNHDCLWCSDLDYRNKYPGFLDPQRFDGVLGELATGGTLSIVWMGSGEPTLHPRFAELIEAAHRHGLKQGLITNGVRLPLDLVPRFEWIRFSVDAAAPETHRRLHQAGARDHERVLQNIERSVGRGPVIGVGYVLQDDNTRELPSFVARLDEWGVDYIQLKRLVPMPQYRGAYEGGDRRFETRHLRVIDTVALETEEDPAGSPCWGSSLSTVIGPTGDVFLCCRLVSERRDEEAWLGNLWSEGGFRAVWHGERRRAVVERALDLEFTSKCPSCSMAPLNRALSALREDRMEHVSAWFL